MCDQCVGACITFGEIVPGWFLIQARRDAFSIKKDQYGLVECNDPDFVWNVKPLEDPLKNLTDDQIDELDEKDPIWKEWKKFVQVEQSIGKILKSNIETGYSLYKACLEGGYNPDKHGHNVSCWLTDQMAVLLNSGKVIETNDGVPSLVENL